MTRLYRALLRLYPELGFTLRNVAAVSLVVPVLLAAAVLASWLLAQRAGRVDPVIALRSE